MVHVGILTSAARGLRDAIRDLERIEARGARTCANGWLRGAEQVALGMDSGAVNRVLLLTDGLANQGKTEPAELKHDAAELRARGISTSTASRPTCQADRTSPGPAAVSLGRVTE